MSRTSTCWQARSGQSLLCSSKEQQRPPTMKLLTTVSFLLLLIQYIGAEDVSEFTQYCLDQDEVAARLSAAETRATKRLTRVTNPSTASTEFRKNMPIVQANGDEYTRFSSYSSCNKLCFSSPRDDEEEVDPFVVLDFRSENDGHHPYDVVLQMANKEDDPSPYLMTTLRDTVDYTMTNYKRRHFWDAPVENIKAMDFREWLDTCKWRTNQFTRMMGRDTGDTRVLTRIVDPTPTQELLADEYMTEQNELGEDSIVLQRAWQRLSQDLHWFGLFHRLPESMELLAYTFCADSAKLQEFYQRSAGPSNDVDKLQSRHVGDISDKEKEELVQEILRRNQLDKILLERAEQLFDERLEEMKQAKQKGILCKFGGAVEVTCGDDDENDGAHQEL